MEPPNLYTSPFQLKWALGRVMTESCRSQDGCKTLEKRRKPQKDRERSRQSAGVRGGGEAWKGGGCGWGRLLPCTHLCSRRIGQTPKEFPKITCLFLTSTLISSLVSGEPGPPSEEKATVASKTEGQLQRVRKAGKELKGLFGPCK